jgi:hypothetical protein
VLEEVAVDIVHPRVAGIDVHKKVIWVAVRLPGAEPGERKVTVKSFKTFWRSLLKMAAWLAELGVTDAAMESTGVYWWPACHALTSWAAGSLTPRSPRWNTPRSPHTGAGATSRPRSPPG